MWLLFPLAGGEEKTEAPCECDEGASVRALC